MTETQSHYATPGSHNFQIPSREDFYKYAGNILSGEDFCTEYPAGYIINKTAASLRWTISKSKKKKHVGGK